MIKVKVSDATGPVLDWMVACVERLSNNGAYDDFRVIEGHIHLRYCGAFLDDPYRPSTDWSQGGPIIDRNPAMQFWPWGGTPDERNGELQCACLPSPIDGCTRYRTWFGSTKLIAAMRCYVASKLGDEVGVPEELLT